MSVELKGRARALASLRADAERLYAKHGDFLATIVLWSVPPSDQRNEIVLQVLERTVRQYISAATNSENNFERFSFLALLKLLCDELKQNPKVRPPKLGGDLSSEFALMLLLRERFEFSIRDLGAIFGASEGSIRTRLESARLALLSVESQSVRNQAIRKSIPGHFCIQVRDEIEDWNPSAAHNELRAIEDQILVCPSCKNLFEARKATHKIILDSPIGEIPDEIKQFPIAPLFIKEGSRMSFNWSAAPWYVRSAFEGLLATAVVVGVVLSIPRIKSAYEFWLERRLDLYSIAELTTGSESIERTENLPPPTSVIAKTGSADNAASTNNEASSGTKDAKIQIRSDSEFRGRDAEIISSDRVYRILIKIDSPETLKEKILAALQKHNYVSADEEAKAGAELPGGIIFDVFVPIKSYKPLLTELFKMSDQAMGPPEVIITRAKERGVAGKARVKIWLQKI